MNTLPLDFNPNPLILTPAGFLSRLARCGILGGAARPVAGGRACEMTVVVRADSFHINFNRRRLLRHFWNIIRGKWGGGVPLTPISDVVNVLNVPR